MRRIMAILGVCMLGALGCKHVGGKCDCGPTPGTNTMYAPNPAFPTTGSESIGAPKALPMPMSPK